MCFPGVHETICDIKVLLYANPMSKSNNNILSEEEIQEELLNNDSSGTFLKKKSAEEKGNNLKEIKPLKNEHSKEASAVLSSPVLFDISSSNFPSLETPGKSNTINKLKLPRKPVSDVKTVEDTDDLLDCDEVNVSKFNLPFCIDDGAPPLPLPEKSFARSKNPYFTLKNETASNALRRMLTHHDAWRDAYSTRMRKIESQALAEDIEDSDSKEVRDSPKRFETEEIENNPYEFDSNSPPVIAPRVYSGARKKETNLISEIVSQSSGRQIQRKTSRDFDCEDVEPILKPEESKLGDWIQTNTRQRSKRNRKVANQEKKGQFEESPEVEFNFEGKWDNKSGAWSTPDGSTSLNNQPRRVIAHTPVVEEEKVQCPICQRNFAQSKVEAHAATCEGYSSSSPMDIEDEN